MPNQILTHTQDSKLLPNVRLFDIPASATETEQAEIFQDVVNYLQIGNLPIVNYCNSIYNLYKSDTAQKRYCFLPTSQMLQNRNYNNKAQPYYCWIRIYYDNDWCYTCHNMWKENATFCYLDAGTTSYNTWFTPTEDLHPATKKYVDDTVAPKLDRDDSTSTLWRAYTVWTDWCQYMVNISQWASNNAIVRRSWTQIIVPNTPTETCHATSKCYVDGNFLPQSEVKKTCVLTQTQFCNCTNKECCTLYLIYQ